jgi:hypothetical protein
MAELGVPTFQQSSAATRNSGGEEDIAVAGQAIAGAAKLVSDEINDKKLRELRGNLNELGDSALNADSTSQPIKQFEIRPELNAEEERLFNDIRDLQNLADRASGTRRTQVVNRAKAMTADALGRTSNPRVRSQLITEFNQFVAINPALDELGMADQQDSLSAEFAEKQMNLMFERSYDLVADGGYGMDSRIIFGSDKWVREFSHNQGRDARVETDLLALRAFETAQQVDVVNQLPVIDRALDDSRGTVDTVIRTELATTGEVGNAMARIANNSAVAGDMELVNEWEVGGKQAMQSQLLAQSAELEILKSRIPTDNAQGKSAVARIDAQQTYIQKWVSIAENMAEKPDLIKLGEYEKEVRQRTWRRKNPETEELIFNLENVAPLLENAETLDLTDSLVTNSIGQFALNSLNTTFANNQAFGDAWQRYNVGAGALLDRASRERATAEAPYGADSQDPQARSQAAMNQVMSSVAARPNFGLYTQSKNIPIGPDFFHAYMGEASQIEELRADQHFEPGLTEQLETLYADSLIADQTMEARTRKLAPGQNTAMQALGESLFRYNTDSDIVGRKQQSSSILNQSFGQVRLQDVVSFDFSELDKGVISVIPNADAGTKAAAVPQDRTTAQLQQHGFFIGPDATLEYQRIEQAATQLEKDINRFLKYEAHVQFMRGNAPKPNYVMAWDQNRYNEIFAQRPRGE